MMKYLLLISIVLLGGLLIAFLPQSQPQVIPSPAQFFLNSLSESQRAKAQFPFENTTRTDWHFLPGQMHKRAGIQLHELNPEQKKMAFTLLKSHLSEAGYDKVQKIIDLENVLAEMGESASYRDPEKYFVAFYGTPAPDSLWAWSFEGHHISLSFTVAKDQVAMVPRFLGANPAKVPIGKRKGERTLGTEEDLGFELVRSLTPEQLTQTMIQPIAFQEIVTVNATEVKPLAPAGIKMEALTQAQQDILWNILHTYLSTMPATLASERLKKLKAEESNDIRFGWAGSLEMDKGHYYRVQGASFLVEFDNTQNNVNHVHTVWRDFEGDFGKDMIREHYHHGHDHK